MSAEWILPFKGRHRSGAVDQNFLWKSNNIYIMDNHRAALWCWLQQVSATEILNLFHVDAHYDTKPVNEATWLSALPNLAHVSFRRYLEFKGSEEYPAIHWDNYLSLFLHLYRERVGEFFTATHLLGEKPNAYFEEVQPSDFAQFFGEYLLDVKNDKKWIVNLDLDYFFCRQRDEYALMFSSSYVAEVIRTLKVAMKKQIITVLTICLSPECVGGWANAEELCAKVTKGLGLDFKLPS